MLAPRDTLEDVPLVAFLDAYPEPAFILCSNPPYSSLSFVYGNSALYELLFRHDSTAVLDDRTFFSALTADEDIVWLSDPIRSGSQSTSGSVGDSRTINVRPIWLPRDHMPIDIELTPTPIGLPITIPGIGSASRAHVFTASPRKAPMNFLRSEPQTEPKRRKDPGLRLPDFPLIPGCVGPNIQSKKGRSKSRSDSSSRLSQPVSGIIPAELPSRLIDTYPWETTPLGPKESWPTTLTLMVKYLMETPVSSAIFWGWPDQVIIYNDPYARMIGSKHPRIFGKTGPVAWGELWHFLAAVSEGVRNGKAVCKADDLLFFSTLTDLHLPEEFYHSWHWTPIWQPDGVVCGVWNTTWETTQKVIAERRLNTMSELSSRLADARTQQEFRERTLEALSRNPLDLPFVALYWCEIEDGPLVNSQTTSKDAPRALSYLRNHSTRLINVTLSLAGSIGIPSEHPIAPSTVKYTLNSVTHRPIYVTSDSATDVGSPGPAEAAPLGQYNESPLSFATSPGHPPTSTKTAEFGLDIARVFASGAIEIVDPLPAHLAQGLDQRGFKDTPRVAAILPVSTNLNQSKRSGDGRTLPYAIILLGLNTRRAYDADYASWIESVGSGLSNQLTVVLQREADMKMMEERERMDKAKTMFFTNVSHELRTPLTLIQAPLEQLLSSGVNNDVQYKLQLATKNCKRLKKLIDSIMDMSKLEAGRLVGSFRPVQLGRVTADLAALFRSLAEKKGINYQIFSDGGPEPLVYVDTDLWEKIICNLLSNAFKYTLEGAITVSITHDPAMSHVSVSDTGVGIPKEHIDQIFERFFRVNTNTAEGTGVGLSLTKELVSLHGGRMSVVSRTKDEFPGHSGSVFTVTIPHGGSHLPPALIQDAARPDAREPSRKDMEYWMELDQPTPSTTSASEEGDSSAASSTFFFEKDDTILVVDDNADMRSYVRKVFTPYLTVFEACDGVEALHIARSHKLNLVLCDVMMPNMDGSELLKRLREERRTRLLPVIFVTASDDPNLLGGRADGAVDYINKPFRIKDLLARAHLQLQLGKRRVKLEEDFEVRSRELQVLTDLSPVGIFRTDADGKVVYANSAWFQITGVPADRTDEWMDHIHNLSKGDAISIFRACFESLKPLSMQIHWMSGCWTHFGISPLVSPEGILLGAFGAVTDINEQHRAEEVRIALAEEREHMAALRAEDAEAQRQLEVERRRAQELLIDVTSHELRQPVSAIIQNAEVVRTNLKGLRDMLHDCIIRSTGYSPTEEMLNELDDDLQAMDSIAQCGQAQARIANDVLSLSRIPLNVLSIIPTEFDIRRETSQILMVFRNELMSKEIHFKLDLGRGAEMFDLQVVRTDRSRYAQIITNLMSNAIRFTDMSTGQRDIKVSLELSPDPPVDDSCAPPPLINGRSFRARSPECESGDITVYIYVSVQDSGPGLQKEDLALLFQRFQQGSNAHHVFGGSGLGLFVCRQLCNLMGGRIEVVSEPGEGAMFRFFVRAAAPSCLGPSRPTISFRRSASVQSKASGGSRGSTKSGSRRLPETSNLHKRPLNVLITEDNKINQTVLARQMKKAGFTTAIASNGLEAIEAIEKMQPGCDGDAGSQKFDVVLMDLEMPVLDGFETTREIRKREADGTLWSRNFIIALTGNARLEQVQAARDAGVDDVMIKPYQIDALISKMRAGPRL